MSWSKEEIMAYVDGQLLSDDMIRVEKIINEDQEANAFYEQMILSNDLINLSYRKLEESYEITKNLSSAQQNEKKNQVKNLVGFGSIAISMKGILIFALGALILIAGTYQISTNKKVSPMDDDYFRVLALKTISDNQKSITTLMARDGNEARVKVKDPKIGNISLKLNSVRFGDKLISNTNLIREIKNFNGICSEILMNIEEKQYIIEACKDETKWLMKYKEDIKLNQLSLK